MLRRRRTPHPQPPHPEAEAGEAEAEEAEAEAAEAEEAEAEEAEAEKAEAEASSAGLKVATVSPLPRARGAGSDTCVVLGQGINNVKSCILISKYTY